MDMTVLQEIDRSGYIDSLYGKQKESLGKEKSDGRISRN
jgi:hypothetical protein